MAKNRLKLPNNGYYIIVMRYHIGLGFCPVPSAFCARVSIGHRSFGSCPKTSSSAALPRLVACAPSLRVPLDLLVLAFASMVSLYSVAFAHKGVCVRCPLVVIAPCFCAPSVFGTAHRSLRSRCLYRRRPCAL